MKLIAHRGNIDGPNQLEENRPEYIDYSIELGYDVEVDVRYDIIEGKFYLGHDGPQYCVAQYWLEKRIDNLWIHCKNIESLYYFSTKIGAYNYFWHQEDDFTLTSKNYIWTYPGKPFTLNSVIVMPELDINCDLNSLRDFDCFGVCSDFISKLK